MLDETNTDEVNDLIQIVETLVLKKLDSKDYGLNDLSAYVSLRASQINELSYSNPVKGPAGGVELVRWPIAPRIPGVARSAGLCGKQAPGAACYTASSARGHDGC